MEKHVTSLELSKKLKELGVKQESEFYWSKEYTGKGWVYEIKHKGYTLEVNGKEVEHLSAFLSSELGEMIPGIVEGCRVLTQKGLIGNLWYVTIETLNPESEEKKQFTAENEAEARGKMVEYLLENNLM